MTASRRSKVNERSISEDGFRQLLSKKVPREAVAYCCELWSDHPFVFKLRRKRVSKLGDYRYDPRDHSHTITINSDLNPYQFLITYVHEVAHRVAHQPGGKQKPHGSDWKDKFRELMLPVIRPEVFPDDLLRAVAQHMRNPKASTAGDPKLVKVLAQYNPDGDASLTLAEIAIGDEFTFRKRGFRKLEKKRTRSLCLDLKNSKRYLIPEMAEVERIGEPKEVIPFYLSQVAERQHFTYKGNTYEKVEQKGNRWLCLKLSDRTVYSIPEWVEVESLND